MHSRRYRIVLPIVLVILSCIGFFLPSLVHAASLSLSTGQEYSVGQDFSVAVLVSSSDQSVNAVSASVAFPPDKLQLLSLSKSGSIVNLWTQEPSFSNAGGTAHFEGVILNPGFTGSAGRVITLVFRVKATGTATLTFPSSSALANDGKGTEIITEARSTTINLKERVPESVQSNPEPTSAEPKPSEPHPKLLFQTVIDSTLASQYLTIAMVLFVLTFAFFCLLLYLFYIVREIKQRIRTSMTRAESVTAKAFRDLHSDIDDHLRLLRKAKTSRDLTDEEEMFVKTFQTHMESAEKGILKEIVNLKKGR
jgi:hypothetical protein